MRANTRFVIMLCPASAVDSGSGPGVTGGENRRIVLSTDVSLAIVYQFEGRSKNRYTGQRAVQDGTFSLPAFAVLPF